MSELIPTAIIPAATESSPLDSAPHNLSDLTVLPDLGWTLADYLAHSGAQGCLVLHKGKIVFENYFGDFRPHSRHILMSITKSVVSSVAGILIDRKVVGRDDLITEHVPQLEGSGWEGIRLRHLLSMRAGIGFSEPREHPHTDQDALRYETAYGWAPGATVDESALDYMRSLPPERASDGPFHYQSILTDMLAWVLEAATKRRIGDLISELLWRPIGASQDAHITVDRFGNALADGGMTATLRDLARFGELWRNRGRAGGVSVVPEWWISSTLDRDESAQRAFDPALKHPTTRSPFYSNNWWVLDPSVPFYAALGYLGQSLFVDQKAGVVIATFAAWETESDRNADRAARVARAIAAHLAQRQAVA